MVTIDVNVLTDHESAKDLWKGGADRYDYSRLPEQMRSQAMLAQGTVVEGLRNAVQRVVEAGQALSWAKAELPHGEYLQWVQQACGLKPQHAQKLIKAAEWANTVHVRHLDGVTDTATLFLLSADTTPEEVREWFMERCAAGDVPSRKEVQDRKRSAGQPRSPQPAEILALSIIRKGEIDRLRQALQLAEQATTVTPDEVMKEQRMRELGKLSYIAGTDADFHRLKDAMWIRMPHSGRIDAVAQPINSHVSPPDGSVGLQPTDEMMDSMLMGMEQAASVLGMAKHSLTQSLTPGAIKKRGGPLARNGYLVTRERRGMVRLSQQPYSPMDVALRS